MINLFVISLIVAVTMVIGSSTTTTEGDLKVRWVSKEAVPHPNKPVGTYITKMNEKEFHFTTQDCLFNQTPFGWKFTPKPPKKQCEVQFEDIATQSSVKLLLNHNNPKYYSRSVDQQHQVITCGFETTIQGCHSKCGNGPFQRHNFPHCVAAVQGVAVDAHGNQQTVSHSTTSQPTPPPVQPLDHPLLHITGLYEPHHYQGHVETNALQIDSGSIYQVFKGFADDHTLVHLHPMPNLSAKLEHLKHDMQSVYHDEEQLEAEQRKLRGSTAAEAADLKKIRAQIGATIRGLGEIRSEISSVMKEEEDHIMTIIHLIHELDNFVRTEKRSEAAFKLYARKLERDTDRFTADIVDLGSDLEPKDKYPKAYIPREERKA